MVARLPVGAQAGDAMRDGSGDGACNASSYGWDASEFAFVAGEGGRVPDLLNVL